MTDRKCFYIVAGLISEYGSCTSFPGHASQNECAGTSAIYYPHLITKEYICSIVNT
jgi:hypothetical protein